jgi:predicted transcriptional regulator
MRFIEEVVVDEFLPTVRSMLAEALRDRGLNQREVADALGISQSAVSKYAHGDVDRHPAVLEDDRVRELVERIADGLAAGDMTQVQALTEFEVVIRELESGDLLAELHEDVMPGLAGTRGSFSIHDPDNPYRYLEVRGTVESIEEENADEHIDKLSRQYIGEDYPSRQPGEVRVKVYVRPEEVSFQK